MAIERLEDWPPYLRPFDRLCVEADLEPEELRRYLRMEVARRRAALELPPVDEPAEPAGEGD